VSSGRVVRGNRGVAYPSKKAAKKAARKAERQSGGRGRYRQPCKSGTHFHCDYYPNKAKARQGKKKNRIGTNHYYWQENR